MAFADDKMKYERTSQRIGIGVWAAVFAALLVTLAYPISIGVIRLFVVFAVPTLWISAVFLVRRRKAIAVIIALAGLLVLGFAALPGRSLDPAKLRQTYVDELRVG